MNLRVGLVGLGEIGKQHARILASLEGIDFVGSYDIDSNRNAFGQNRPVFNSLKDLLGTNLDYIVIAVPPSNHLEVATVCADFGVHALIEKPLANNSDSARKILEIFTDRSLIGAVGHLEVFNAGLQTAKSSLGLLGTIFQISTQRRGPRPLRIKDVGVALDLATHDFQLTSWLLGNDYRQIAGQVLHQSNSSYEDMVVVVGQLSNGILVNHLVDWISPRKIRNVTITGKNGSFEIDLLRGELIFYEANSDLDGMQHVTEIMNNQAAKVIRFSGEQIEPLLVEHQNFRDLVLGKVDMKTNVSLHQGLEAVLIAEQVLASAQNSTEFSL
jgi:predicted dehydrogenase